MEYFTKLQQEKLNRDQQWAVISYALSKDSSDPIGYFIFLQAFDNRRSAEEYTREVIERTGVNSVTVVKACRFLPLSRQLSKVIPVDVNAEGKLIQIADEIHKKEKEQSLFKIINDKVNQLVKMI